MPAPENKAQQRPGNTAGVSMRDLLAAGAAAKAISTPPRVADRTGRSPRPRR